MAQVRTAGRRGVARTRDAGSSLAAGAGLSRRQLLRRGAAAGIAVWLAELAGGTLAFAWSAIGVGCAEGPRRDAGRPRSRRTRVCRSATASRPTSRRRGRSSISSTRVAASWQPGVDPTGDGSALNVRALSQRCPHLGCRPNPCIEDYWFRCPCHQSRYDRLGIKAAGERFGPAPRAMDRFAIEVDGDGVLTIDTTHITLGPLPVALGEPGIIPPRVENGCVK